MLLEACAQSERSWNPFRPPTADTVATVPPCVLGCLAELGEDADASLAAADVGSVLVELPAVVSAATAAARLGRKVATSIRVSRWVASGSNLSSASMRLKSLVPMTGLNINGAMARSFQPISFSGVFNKDSFESWSKPNIIFATKKMPLS